MTQEWLALVLLTCRRGPDTLPWRRAGRRTWRRRIRAGWWPPTHCAPFHNYRTPPPTHGECRLSPTPRRIPCSQAGTHFSLPFRFSRFSQFWSMTDKTWQACGHPMGRLWSKRVSRWLSVTIGDYRCSDSALSQTESDRPAKSWLDLWLKVISHHKSDLTLCWPTIASFFASLCTHFLQSVRSVCTQPVLTLTNDVLNKEQLVKSPLSHTGPSPHQFNMLNY